MNYIYTISFPTPSFPLWGNRGFVTAPIRNVISLSRAVCAPFRCLRFCVLRCLFLSCPYSVVLVVPASLQCVNACVLCLGGCHVVKNTDLGLNYNPHEFENGVGRGCLPFADHSGLCLMSRRLNSISEDRSVETNTGYFRPVTG